MTMKIFGYSILKGIYTSFLLSTISFAIASDDVTTNNASAPSLSLLEQSQQFWQNQLPDTVDNSFPLTVPTTIRTGRAITNDQNEEIEKTFYRRALNHLILQELPTKSEQFRQACVRALEENVSAEAMQVIPTLVSQMLPAFIVNSCAFQANDTFEETSKKLTELGIKIINVHLPMSKADKNKITALCFSSAAYKALQMEQQVDSPYQCDYYVSVTELFAWGAYRYEGTWAKQHALSKASLNLEKAMQSLKFISEEDQSQQLQEKIWYLQNYINLQQASLNS